MAEPMMTPPLVAPPPIRSARSPSQVQALAQMQRGPGDGASPASILEGVGRQLLTLIQQHPEMRPKLTEALRLLTEAATEGLGAGGMPPGPPGMPGPSPPPDALRGPGAGAGGPPAMPPEIG